MTPRPAFAGALPQQMRVSSCTDSTLQSSPDGHLGGFDPTAGSDGSLAKARERAWAAKELVKQGIDPLVERDRREAAVAVAAAQAAQRAYTFQQCAEAYITAKRPGWKNEKHAAQWTSTLTTYAYPIIGKTPVAD